MPKTSQSGFTLIELMIAVAIIAILASIALPQYNQYVRSARRAEAIANLKSVQLQLERWRVDHSSYSGMPSAFGSFNSTHYTYAISGATATDYTLSATATSADQKKDKCGDLSIVKTGATVQNKAATTTCW